MLMLFLLPPFHLEPQSCKSDSEFRCADGQACIDVRRRCDLHPDCIDGSDEVDCGEWV